MDLLTLFLHPALAVLTFVTTGFVMSIFLKRNDIADTMWGPGIFLASLCALFWNDRSLHSVEMLLLLLIGTWAVRLGLRIFLKNRHKSEDPRYQKWRASWKFFYVRSYLQVFLLQGFLMLILASSSIIASSAASTLTIPMYLGLITWIIGFLFEVVADHQLDTFLKKPENKESLMRYGLWKYSRHPNYFGEITMWWGIWLIAFAATMHPLTLISPITITLLIVFVSGIPTLEPLMEKNSEWAEYKKKTSILIPWFVKSK